MSHNKAALYHSNGYNAQAACEHCEGIIRHELWCQTLNPVVCYAYQIVVSSDLKTRSPSTAYSPSSPESLELPEMKYPTLLGVIPRSPSSITWHLPFGSLRDSGDGDEIRNNDKTTLGR